MKVYLKKQGFTLIEVMISIGMISMILVAALGLRNRDIRINEEAIRLTNAVILAHKQIALIDKVPEVGKSSGEFDKNFRWEEDVNYTILEKVRELKFSVFWKDYPEALDEKKADFTLFFLND